MSFFRRSVLFIFFIFALLVSILLLIMPGFILPEPPAPTGYLRDYHGRVAFFEPEADPESPEQVYDIYTRLLPESDVLALQAGVKVSSEEELERLLEDYGY